MVEDYEIFGINPRLLENDPSDLPQAEPEHVSFTNDFVPWEAITQPDLYDVYRDTVTSSWEQAYPSSERQSESFEPFRQFIEKLPMYWMPRKEEIARLLSVAVQAHNARSKKGEIAPEDPIQIIDVGGGNGALAALLIDLAHENNCNIHITIVDPNTKTVEEAKKYYGYDPRYYDKIDFFVGTAAEYAKQADHTNEQTQRLYQARDTQLHHAQQQFGRFRQLEELLSTSTPQTESALVQQIQQLLQEEFGLPPMPTDFMADKPWLEPIVKLRYYAFSHPKDSLRPYVPPFVTKNLDIAQKKLEHYLANQPATVDLVINSWMPSRQDFTRDIRDINGATIAYALETWGATGIQEHARFPEHIDTVGQEDSYQPGESYTNVACWVGDSIASLARRSRTSLPRTDEEQTRFLQDLDDSPVTTYYDVYSKKPTNPDDDWEEEDPPELPFGNTIMIQSHKRYQIPHISPKHQDIIVGQQYPWESTLIQTTGEASPITYFRDYVSLGEYHQVIGAAIQNAQRQQWQTIDTSELEPWESFFDE